MTKDDITIGDIPTAVMAKNVLSLISAHTEKNEQMFKEVSLEIAHELELNGKDELAHYIYAQYGLVRTFEVTD